MYFQTNGYALKLSEKIFNSFSSKVYLNSHDLHILQKFKEELSHIKFIGNNLVKFTGPKITLELSCELILDNNRTNEDLRFEGKYPTQNLLFIDSKLPSNRLENIALITENGKYIIL